MLRQVLALGLFGILVVAGDVLSAEPAGGTSGDKAAQSSKVEPDRQLVFKVKGLT